MRADVDLDQHVERARRPRVAAAPMRRSRGGVVDQHADRGVACASAASRASFAAPTISLVTSTSAMPAATNDLGLADLLAADADGAARDLRRGDVRALVRLARAAAARAATPRTALRHQIEIALERVEVDDERRRVDRRRRDRRSCGRRLHRGNRNPRRGYVTDGRAEPSCGCAAATWLGASWRRPRRAGRRRRRDREELRAVEVARQRVAAACRRSSRTRRRHSRPRSGTRSRSAPAACLRTCSDSRCLSAFSYMKSAVGFSLPATSRPPTSA